MHLNYTHIRPYNHLTTNGFFDVMLYPFRRGDGGSGKICYQFFCAGKASDWNLTSTVSGANSLLERSASCTKGS